MFKPLWRHSRLRLILITSLLLVLLNLFPLIAQAAPSSPATHLYHVVGYYTSWSIYAPQYDITQIPADQLTHLNYAFAKISDTGECALGDEYADTQYPYVDGSSGNMGELVTMKSTHPQLKTLISVGGYTWSTHFSDVAASAESRQHFAASCVDFMLAHGFDGIDIDWEFPVGKGAKGNSQRPEDGENFILLLQELRSQLTERGNANGQTYLLTIAAGNDPEQYATLDWARIYPLLDWINVMTYDMSGAQDGTTGLNAPLYPSSTRPDKPSIDRTITDLLGFGIEPSKLVLGIPFYGIGWKGVGNVDQGLYQPVGKLADGTLGPGYFDYSGIAPDLINRYPHYWDNNAQESWLYDSNAGIFISYEDAESLAAKITYMQHHQLGGVMIWELSMDDDQHSLMSSVFSALQSETG